MVTTMEVETLASGPGWSVRENLCHAGPADRPFEECHDTVSFGAVMEGTFHYRNNRGSALLGPGAVLLGNAGCHYECSHEHGVGDRCLSVHFSRELWEEIVSAAGTRAMTDFGHPALPPVSSLFAPIARLKAAQAGRGVSWEETALAFGGAVLRLSAELAASHTEPSARDRARISGAMRRIEACALDPKPHSLSLGELARQTGLGTYHFLRSFKRVAGLTPHQYLLHLRMQQAVARLADSDTPIGTIAFDAGFGDLSTFNQRFRRLMGTNPKNFRQQMRIGV